MDRKNHLWFFFQFLQEVGKGMSKEEEKQVMIEKAINLKLMCDYAVSCSYGDIVLIICMLHDYVKMLDGLRADDIQYQAYYRQKFMQMADRLAGQIGYDYDQAVEKMQKKPAEAGKQQRHWGRRFVTPCQAGFQNIRQNKGRGWGK